MVTIEKLKSSDEVFVRKIMLDDEQVKYTASPEDFLLKEDGLSDRFVVLHEGNIVGYFKIVRHFSRQIQPCEDKAIGLRKFAIDQRHQGKGLGLATVDALACVMRSYYPDDEWMYLTVNCKNTIAYRCYVKGGFEDTNTFFLGGPNGPQHIMRLALG